MGVGMGRRRWVEGDWGGGARAGQEKSCLPPAEESSRVGFFPFFFFLGDRLGLAWKPWKIDRGSKEQGIAVTDADRVLLAQ